VLHLELVAAIDYIKTDPALFLAVYVMKNGGFCCAFHHLSC
jgi:hypothetical protein